MIELIFVIVILGILASVAIPRLAATREDAEISAAVANLRTLVSDVSAYHVVKGTFTGAKWNEITNVPLKPKNTDGSATGDAYLKVGDQNDCITVILKNKETNKPAHIFIAKKNGNGVSAVCTQVLNADPLKPYLNSKVTNVTTNNNQSAIAIGSSTSIYETGTTTPATTQGTGAARS